jgi:oxygen-independent coproporphyrinogen-3 oxidase
VGVQTFHEPSRQAVHRAGTAEQVKQGLRTIAAVFPGGFSVDLMTGLPFQDTAVLRTDIETLLLYEPAHISLYALTVEPGSALEQGKLLPDTDTADSLFIQGRDILESAGFAQYEVSNFAKPSKHSLHNTRYWRMESWLGCGAGASGTVIDEGNGTGLRTRYRDEADTYMIDRHRIRETEYLDRLTLMKETFLMGFRYSDGPDPLLFEKRFGIGIRHCIPGTLSRWEAQGMIAPGTIALNSAGLLFLNLFLQDIFEEISEK